MIGFSGIDGAGKSTQVELLLGWLRSRGVPAGVTKVKFHAMPAVFRLSEKLFGNRYAYHPTIPATLREFTAACDVVEHYFREVEPLRARGQVILWDRCVHCYAAYAAGYGAEMDWLNRLYEMVPEPSVTFLLDLPEQEARRRLLRRKEKPIKADESLEVFRTVRRCYLERAQAHRRIEILAADRSQEEVQRVIRARLASYFPIPSTGSSGEVETDAAAGF